MSDREKFIAAMQPMPCNFDERAQKFTDVGVNLAWFAWQASRRAALEETPTPSAIEATAALIANGLVGQASEEDVREVERLILELLGRKE